jgi:hypothetical protein
MLERVLAARIPFAWFTADEASGQAGYLFFQAHPLCG